MNTLRLASPSSALMAAALAALAACGGDSDASSGSSTGSDSTNSGSTGEATTRDDSAPTSTDPDGSTDESSDSGPTEVPPGGVLESETFYEIGADANISELASSPTGGVYVVLDAYFPDVTSSWQLHRLGGELWPSPRAGVLAFEPDGSILNAGRLTSSADFGGGRVTSAGDSDVVIVKRAPDGAHVYTRVFGDVDGQHASDLGIDGDGNVVVGGVFRGAIDFGFGPLVSDEYDRFLLRLDPQGDVIDAVHLDDTNDDTQLHVAGTPGGYVAAARAGDGLDIAGTSLSSVEAGTTDIVVAGFDLTGALVWTRVLAIPGDEILDELVVAPGGEILLLAGAASEVDLGTGSTAPAGTVLVRLDASGVPLAVLPVDASVDADVAVNASGEIALAGSFSGYAAERWDADGTSAWRTELSGAHGLLVTFDGDGNVVAAGQRQNTDDNFDVVVTTLAH